MKAFRITSEEYCMNQPSVFLFVDGSYYGDLDYPRLRGFPSGIDYWRNATCADDFRYFHIKEVYLSVYSEKELKKLHACVDVLKSHIRQHPDNNRSFDPDVENFNRPYETALSLVCEKINALISGLS